MGGIVSSLELEEDESDDVNDSTTDDMAKLEANINSFIIENKEASSVFSVRNVASEYKEIKNSILSRKRETDKYLYEDLEFPAEQHEEIVWKRPTEISNNPSLLKDGLSSEDVKQGRLGDCWFLASCAAISRSSKRMRKIIPTDQSFTGSDYVGMFHFRFWRFGNWVDVIVDDLLPTRNGSLCYGRSADSNEFWLPLLEKAYAKIHNSYQAIEGGLPDDALEDLTGGIAVKYDLRDETPDHLFRTLHKALRNGSFACAGIVRAGNVDREMTGLVSAHAYAVIKVHKIKHHGRTVKLVKIRNPWGGKQEWKLDWSDSSDMWDSLDENVKERLGYEDKDNGEWFMTFHDFARHFSQLTICSIGPDFDGDGAPTGDSWRLSTINGEWTDVSGGVSAHSFKTYAKNPQYLIELREPDDFNPAEDEPVEEGKCSVIIGLMQEYRRAGKDEGLKNLALCLHLFKVNERPRRKLNARFFRGKPAPVTTSGKYKKRREVTLTAELDPGMYVVVPSTSRPSDEATFLIRIFTEKAISVTQL